MIDIEPTKRVRCALVTGAGGLLGRSISRRLSSSGWRVVEKTRQAMDVSNEPAVKAAIESEEPDLIVNCAAATDVDRCERDPDWGWAVNVLGCEHLARAATRRRAELVHISTDYVFDGEKQGLYTQEDEPHPLSRYGRSKLAGELFVRRYCARAYVIRSSWIFGQGGKNFGSRVIDYAKSGAALKGVVDQVSIPTYAPDLASRIEEIVELGTYGLFHVTNTGPATWYDFTNAALRLAGMEDVIVTPVNRRDLRQDAERPKNSAMRCLLSERLGLAPLRHWQDALADFIPELTL
jgi:dTDP-4-dehydrorhamnose reductase